MHPPPLEVTKRIFPYYYIFLLLQYYINIIHIHSQIIDPLPLLHYSILTSLCVMHYAELLPLREMNKGTSPLLHYCIISLLCSRHSSENLHQGPP